MASRLVFENFGGENQRDQRDMVLWRSHAPVQGGVLQRPGIPAEMQSSQNLDYYPEGIGKRKGSITVTYNLTVLLDNSLSSISAISNPKNFAINGLAVDSSGVWIGVGAADGTDAYFITSPNGRKWTEVTNPKNFALNAIAAKPLGGGSYIAVGAADGTDAYLLNVLGYTTILEGTNAKNFALNGVCWSRNNIRIAVGAADGTDAYIITGSTAVIPVWTERANAKNFALNSIAHNNHATAPTFVAVGGADGVDAYIVTSTDNGVTWTERANPKNFALNAVAFYNGVFVAVGAADGVDAYLITSNDNGVTWTERTNPANVALNDVTYASGGWIAVGNDDATDPYMIRSTDGGITWTEIDTPNNVFDLYAIARPPDDAPSTLNVVAAGQADGTDAYMLGFRIIDVDKQVAGTYWVDPVNNLGREIVVTRHTIFVHETWADGAWTQVTDEAGSTYYHLNPVEKAGFAATDGHLFIGLDGQNKIQVHRGGTFLDDELDTGNTYREVYTSTTHTMTGTFPTGAYLLTTLHSRLVWSTGNTLIEYTPMAYTPSSGVWDLLGDTSGFIQTVGSVRFLDTFVPAGANAIEDVLYIGHSEGVDFSTGFQEYDRLIRVQGSLPPVNHKAYFKSKNWLVYLTEDKKIIGINGQYSIDIGRRLSSTDKTGTLDIMDSTASRLNACGYYSPRRNQGRIWFSTDPTYENDTCAVIDMDLGEPYPGEQKESFEMRVRCLTWKIKNPANNKWFIHVFRTPAGNYALVTRNVLYLLENGYYDLDSTAIEANLMLPVFSGPPGAIHNKKTVMGVDTRLVAGNTGSVSLMDYLDRALTSAKDTITLSQVATEGNIAGAYSRLNRRAQAVNLKLENLGGGESFILNSLGLTYEIGGAIQR